MKFKLSTSHVIREDTSAYIEESHYIRDLHITGVHLVDNNHDDYDFEADFSLEQLQKNDKKVFIPYIGVAKVEEIPNRKEYFLFQNETVKYLGVFLTEKKAKNVQEIITLISTLSEKIEKYGINSNETKVFSKEVKNQVKALGGDWIQDKDSIIGITFLNESNETVYFDNTLNCLGKINDNNIYVANITPLPKKRIKIN